MGWGGLPASWLPFVEGQPFGFRASICVEAIWPTSAGRHGCMIRLLRTAKFGLLLGAVAHLLSRRGDGKGCPDTEIRCLVSAV